MKMNKLCVIGLLAALSLVPASAQLNTLTQTTTSAAVLLTDNSISLTSVTGVVTPSAGVNGSLVYVISPGSIGEAMRVQSLSGTTVKVARGTNGTARKAQTLGATVLIGPPDYFFSSAPSGACVTATTKVLPYVNITTGLQWLCSSVTLSWVPGFGNNLTPDVPTAAVASVAGVITPSGPIFHVTGTNAITGFTVPVGYTGGPICLIPDAVFTTTNAGNIALGSTAVVGKALCYTYDPAAAKPFFPSY